MGFDASKVEVLAYDFTSFPTDGAVDPSERCSGRGRIAEPSKAKLEAFWNAQASVLDEVAKAADAGDEIDADEVKAKLEDSVYQRLSDVCSGRPSVDELKQLPPRILFAFAKYLAENLAPKA